MCDVMTSALAYYDKELMTTIKSFTTKLIIVVKRFIVQNQALIF